MNDDAIQKAKQALEHARWQKKHADCAVERVRYNNCPYYEGHFDPLSFLAGLLIGYAFIAFIFEFILPNHF